VPTTAGRSRGRQGVRSGAQGAVGEHLPKIMTALITGLVVIAFALVMTKPGQDIDAATQHFMLFYAGVFALIGLTASVGVGLVATDRIVMTPGHRVMAQAVHRAVSFGALAFLVIHIVTEILAQRAHVIDAFIPFLSPYRTFYIGLGTIASDLILLIIVTSIWRKRFTSRGKAWRWRAIHYTSYVAFVFGVLHGLLGGRAAKPYVDWSYGFAIALTALAVVVRFLAISLRSKDKVTAPPGADRASGGLGYSGTSPLRSAALSMAQAQLRGTIQMLPTAVGAQGSGLGLPGSQAWAALPPAPDWAASSGPLPALPAGTGYAADPSLMPLGAPVYGEPATAGTGSYPYPAAPGRRPLYEPEYDGPPRFQGAPRKHVPQDDLSSYPYAAQGRPPGWGNGGSGPLPLSPPPRLGSGPTPRAETGPTPRADSGPMPRLGSGPMPIPGSGSMPRTDSGPMPRLGSGPMPIPGSGSMPRADSGPMPRLGSGPLPRTDSGPMPRLGSGPMPIPGSGSMPRADSGPMPRLGSGPMPIPGSGSMPRADSGPMPRLGTGPMPRLGTGSVPHADSGPMPRLGSGPVPRTDSGPAPRLVAGPLPHPDTGPMPRVDTGPLPRPGTGPVPRADSGAQPRPGTGPGPRTDTGPMPRLGSGPMPIPGSGSMPRADSGPTPRPGTGPRPRPDSGPMPRPGSGPSPRANTGPMPRLDTGPLPRADSGPMPRLESGPVPRADSGPMPRADSGPMSRADSGPMSRADSGPMPRGTAPVHGADYGSAPWSGTEPSPHAAGSRSRADGGPRAGSGSVPSAEAHHGPRTGPAPATATRRSRRTHATDPRYRDTPGRSGGDEWR
jgi:DMSO/TMAO reductase YedYZ heme-binding membrane subunit